MARYMVHRNSGNAVFVKEGNFFDEQVRDSKPEPGREKQWWEAWTRVDADSIEHARLIGETTLPRVNNNAWSFAA